MNPFSHLLNAVVLAQGTAPATDAGAVPRQGQEQGLLDIILSGGVVGLVILLVLVGLSIAAAYLLFDQIMTLRRVEILPDGVSESVRQALLTGRPAEADAT